ncbi:MAG TPA: FAD-dependent oxidoreductase, partial [Burkholderiales bacterium]|nr:FAD-dependent oxidoreductase [Burkholderiales bacterium]
MPQQKTYGVAIIGGGIMGCSTAYFLKTLAPALEVCVIESDPTYEFCSTLRASGGARRLFSCPENIAMSNWSIEFIQGFPKAMAVDGREAPVDWVEGGYLFIVPPEGMGILEQSHAAQLAQGCEVELLTPTQLKERFPSMHVDDLAGGSHSLRDGWCDPNGLLQGFRRKVISLGVTFIQDRVTGLSRQGAALTASTLSSGAQIRATHFVNAAGAWSGEVAALAGMRLPVSPLRRFEHYFTAGNPIERLPYVK